MSYLYRKDSYLNFHLAIILFFSFFSSFAICNISSLDWGFQFSWALLCIFSLLEILFFFTKPYFFKEKKYIKLLTSLLCLSLLVITVFDWIYLQINPSDISYNGINSNFKAIYKSNNLLNRSFFHTCYIVFLNLTSFFVFQHLNNLSQTRRIGLISKYFITLPFFFIGVWGIYQWLTTYGLFPYCKLFNNSISTGFTYLRFMGDHRTSSIFPEPSEYAYFLGWYLPLVISFFSRGTNFFTFKQNRKNRYFLLFFYLLQVGLCRSFSYFAIFPVILFITIYCADIPSRTKFIYKFLYLIILILGICAAMILFGERFNAIISGTDGSMLVRLSVFYDGIVLFLNRKLLGYGYGCIRGMDLLSATLAFFGIIGVVIIIIFLVLLNKFSKKNKYSHLLFVGYICFLLTGCISNPLYEFLPFWIIPIFIEVLSKSDVNY